MGQAQCDFAALLCWALGVNCQLSSLRLLTALPCASLSTSLHQKLTLNPFAGLPESALELAAQAARAEGHEGVTPEAGPWSFGLDFPSYFPVMTHAKNR